MNTTSTADSLHLARAGLLHRLHDHITGIVDITETLLLEDAHARLMQRRIDTQASVISTLLRDRRELSGVLEERNRRCQHLTLKLCRAEHPPPEEGRDDAGQAIAGDADLQRKKQQNQPAEEHHLLSAPVPDVRGSDEPIELESKRGHGGQLHSSTSGTSSSSAQTQQRPATLLGEQLAKLLCTHAQLQSLRMSGVEQKVLQQGTVVKEASDQTVTHASQQQQACRESRASTHPTATQHLEGSGSKGTQMGTTADSQLVDVCYHEHWKNKSDAGPATCLVDLRDLLHHHKPVEPEDTLARPGMRETHPWSKDAGACPRAKNAKARMVAAHASIAEMATQASLEQHTEHPYAMPTLRGREVGFRSASRAEIFAKAEAAAQVVNETGVRGDAITASPSSHLPAGNSQSCPKNASSFPHYSDKECVHWADACGFIGQIVCN